MDPLKDASAQTTRLQNHTTTLAYEYAQQGRDWESEIRQRAKEVALMNKLSWLARCSSDRLIRAVARTSHGIFRCGEWLRIDLMLPAQ
ncbi:MAG: hypothetical protein ABFC96_03050 [Thermoguttaceae bacterium]